MACSMVLFVTSASLGSMYRYAGISDINTISVHYQGLPTCKHPAICMSTNALLNTFHIKATRLYPEEQALASSDVVDTVALQHSAS